MSQFGQLREIYLFCQLAKNLVQERQFFIKKSLQVQVPHFIKRAFFVQIFQIEKYQKYLDNILLDLVIIYVTVSVKGQLMIVTNLKTLFFRKSWRINPVNRSSVIGRGDIHNFEKLLISFKRKRFQNEISTQHAENIFLSPFFQIGGLH